MTRPHLIAKLIFAAMGVHFLMQPLGRIASSVIMLSQNCPPETFATKISIIAAESVITFVISLILLFWSDGLVRIIAGPDTDECAKVDECWVIAGLRLAACFCGLLIIYHRIELLFYYIPAIINGPNILSYMTLEGQSSLLSTKTSVGILVETAKWIFAIYLILGAPHYVRRQMRVLAVKEHNQTSGGKEYEQK
ncbi:MAG: hypothetical protein ABSA64_05560 [Sedimentisphaerales bacterium]|jgi:hypothetical protein